MILIRDRLYSAIASFMWLSRSLERHTLIGEDTWFRLRMVPVFTC